MNNIVLPIKDLAYSVERPVVFDVVKQLMDITQISSKTPVRVFGDDARALQKNSTIDGIDNEEFNKWPFDDNITVEVIEDFDQDRILSTPVKQAENIFIYQDNSLEVYVKPVYAVCNISIIVKYRSTDKNKANTWRNDIKTKTSMGRDVNLHDLTYSYHLPEEIIIILKEIHRLREKQAGYGQDFEQYFSEHISTKANIVSTQDGENAHWVISEKQTRIQGLFDFQGIPEKPEKDGEASAYTVTFTYKFSYDKPIHFNMVYPIMIHNQLLNKKYRQDLTPYTLETKSRSYSLSALNFSRFEDGEEILKAYGNKGLDIPSFDIGFFPNSIPSATARVCTILCNITPDNLKFLFNLNDLGDFVLDKDILEFIKQEKSFIPKSYGSIICLHLYENSYLKQSGSLEIDENLNVFSSQDLDLRKVYRVRLGIVVNLHLLNKQTLLRIKDYIVRNNSFGLKVAKSINSVLRDIGNDPDVRCNRLLEDDLITLGLLKSPFSNSNLPVNHPLYNPNDIRQQLVQNFFVVSDIFKEN